ncbi:sensor histidine kinase [Actinomadura rayongensis]|uniref:histidine kinase n=1 Tax=Actinomadura rayongensis TaxID=1429076 RepID=A0A6I4W7V6_9ACTN|nr:HAMP domain-containing sensor histidine kinase [Actinomadura rayongensis]MXQ64830.1 HAMP domain-containing protein [Actinomadura rayongensis]
MSVRRFAVRTSLRTRLIAGALLLVALGLTVMSAASVGVLRTYLVGRADAQLHENIPRAVDQVAPQLVTDRAHIVVRMPSEMFIEVRDADGRLRESDTPPFGTSGRPRLTAGDYKRVDEPFTAHGTDRARTPWRVITEPLPGGDVVVLALSLEEVERTVGRLVAIDMIVGGLVVAGITVLGVWAVGASLRPLREIERTAGAIAAGDLSRRVPAADRRTEVGRLGLALNGMLSQIEAAFGARAVSEASARRSEERMRRFVADASHELRTPLTAIRGFAELYRQGAARSPDELDRLIGRIEDAASRMGLLVEDLLLLARLDRQRPIERTPVDLLAVAADSVREARVVAPERDIELTVDGTVAYQVLGDEPRLRQVFGNLLANAVAHTPPDTPIEVRLRPGTLGGAPAAVCEVADQGPGLSGEQRERVFERFYRVDEARSRGGTGLGLAIVAALVAAHDGRVEVESEPGRGATFRVLLPLD